MSVHINKIFSIPGYSILEKIYAGSKTLVCRGIREHDQKPVIIKAMQSKHPSFTQIAQFRNQYAIAVSLQFSGIVQTYSLENFDNSYALVMEDFGGVSLRDYLDRFKESNTISLQEFFHIAVQIASTLHQLHRNHVIHKDIKPANILINPNTFEVKLADFSIASLLPKEIQYPLAPNILEGTLAYISPEQTGRMNRGIDYRSDFYSLGVTFFELLTGQYSLQNQIQEIDLDFLKEDLPKILHFMKLGTNRIKNIVLGLRNFSRLDEAEMKPVDIHEEINSTLMILHHKLKAKVERPEIKVIKEYGKLPQVECYVNQMNQVFMNILVNAIDALELGTGNSKLGIRKISSLTLYFKSLIPTIIIRTLIVEKHIVEILIADNGSGIAPEVIQKIFDPFFTTKPIGSGTGLGLSISYQIVVEKHKGSLTCNSLLGQGTEFIIKIPIKQNKACNQIIRNS
ncbi:MULTISPECIES: protein kinase domain-containing protein [Nostocales]|uniref:histidine kinase n=3 Tax=Nostocales TaxID=1161 RepID=A0A0C1RC86_9CYAN|nr:protein kinase [Tolypothrix bouteillei VB521301]